MRLPFGSRCIKRKKTTCKYEGVKDSEQEGMGLVTSGRDGLILRGSQACPCSLNKSTFHHSFTVQVVYCKMSHDVVGSVCACIHN